MSELPPQACKRRILVASSKSGMPSRLSCRHEDFEDTVYKISTCLGPKLKTKALKVNKTLSCLRIQLWGGRGRGGGGGGVGAGNYMRAPVSGSRLGASVPRQAKLFLLPWSSWEHCAFNTFLDSKAVASLHCRAP